MTTQADKQNQVSFQTPVEGQFTLDSTVLGISTIVSNLDVPWEIIWGPDNWIWFTEQGGRVSKVNPATGEKKVLLTIPDVFRKRSMGLLGMAIHPDKRKSPYVFLDYTYLKDSVIFSRLVRYTYTADTLTNPLVLLENIPGANGHNGSRVVVAPDGKVMFSTGDINVSKNAQDVHSLNGKILRLNTDGTIPTDNPIAGSPIWSWGHRNVQGLAYTANGLLFSSEHGDASDDEINIIRKGANYGWPQVQGFCNLPEEKTYCQDSAIVEPLQAWTPVIAPAGIDYYNAAPIAEWQHAILLTTLKDQSVRVLKLNKAGNAIVSEQKYFDKAFGRIRDVCVSPNGDVYLSTSNRDWNPAEGFPKATDDRIIRIFKTGTMDNLTKASASGNEQIGQVLTNSKGEEAVKGGNLLYNQYCGACHKSDGNGVAETFPPLSGAQQVTGDKKELIQIVLKGLSGPVQVKGVEYNQQMPAFNFLSDQQIAEILSFVRTQFGNKASIVTADEVREVRGANK